MDKCINGHPYTPENTRRNSVTGRRFCWVCRLKYLRKVPNPNIEVDSTRRGEPADPAVVQRAIEGKPVTLSFEERDEVTDILTRRGWSLNEIARLLGCSPRSIERARQRLRK